MKWQCHTSPETKRYNDGMSVYEVSVERSFKAVHALELPAGGREDAHEHTWCVTAAFRSESLVEPMGVVMDFVAVDEALAAIAESCDGADLNSMPAFSDRAPSAERVAEWFAGLLEERLGADGRLYSVTVTEAPGCRAAFFPARRT